MREIYYKKVGKRYKPVSVYDSGVIDSFPQGSHLLVVDGGWRSYLRNVDPDYAPILAALHLCREPVLEVLRQASMYRFRSQASNMEKEAFEAYKAIAGENALMSLEGPSILGMVETMEKTLLEHIKKTSPRGTV